MMWTEYYKRHFKVFSLFKWHISTGSTVSLLQKLLFGFCIVGIPYIRERSIDIKGITDRILDLNSVSTCWFVSCNIAVPK